MKSKTSRCLRLYVAAAALVHSSVRAEEAAWVNGESISEAHVQWEMSKYLGQTPKGTDADADDNDADDNDADDNGADDNDATSDTATTSSAERKAIRKQALELLVRRQLVIQYLCKNKLAASEPEIDLEIQRIERRLKRVEKTLPQFLKERGTDAEILRRDVEWQISWKRALAKYLTPESTAKYYRQKKRHFDGSRLRVAHILLKVTEQRGREKAIRELADLRKRIDSKELTFIAAAKKHSAAPTKDKGGDMGWIERKDPMPESFSKAAFDLADDAISEPVVTAFGVHLIKVLEHEAGQKKEEDVTANVHDDMRRYMFDWLADRHRKDAEIRYSQ